MSSDASIIRRFRVDVSEADWLAASWLVIRHYWLWRRIALAFFGLWLGCSAIDIATVVWHCGCVGDLVMLSIRDSGVIAVAACFLFAFVIVTFTPGSVKKRYAEEAKLSPDPSSEFAFDAAGLRLDTGVRKLDVAWSHFIRWHENAKVMVLVLSWQEILVLPKPGIDPMVIDDLRDHLIAAKVERGLT